MGWTVELLVQSPSCQVRPQYRLSTHGRCPAQTIATFVCTASFDSLYVNVEVAGLDTIETFMYGQSSRLLFHSRLESCTQLTVPDMLKTRVPNLNLRVSSRP